MKVTEVGKSGAQRCWVSLCVRKKRSLNSWVWRQETLVSFEKWTEYWQRQIIRVVIVSVRDKPFPLLLFVVPPYYSSLNKAIDIAQTGQKENCGFLSISPHSLKFLVVTMWKNLTFLKKKIYILLLLLRSLLKFDPTDYPLCIPVSKRVFLSSLFYVVRNQCPAHCQPQSPVEPGRLM